MAVTRFANIYGGGDLNFSRLVPEAIAAVLDGRAPVMRSDGSPERDFLYVEDAVAAYLAIADLLDAGPASPACGEAFNAGGERAAPRCSRSSSDVRAPAAARTSSPTSAAPASRTARSTASAWTRRGCASSPAGSRRSTLERGPAAHASSGTASTPAGLAAA